MIKIKTETGYYVVSEDSSLSESALKALASEIKKQPKLTQPNFFIDMRYDYKYAQLQALLKITELLQPIILNNIKKGSSSLVETESVCLHKDRQEIEVIIPLSAFGWQKHYYPTLRTALIAMATIPVSYPKWSLKIKRTLYGEGPLCSYVAISPDENNRRRELVHFFFSMDVATCMVSPQSGFTRLLLQSLNQFSNIYTTKIYLQICRSVDAGKWVVSYSNLRKLLCVGNKFGRYYDFRSRILKETENILKCNSNCWFDLVECFKTGSSSPYLLIFNIYSAANQQGNYDRFNLFREKMLSTITDSLRIKKGPAQALIRKINMRNYLYIWNKHNQLLAHMLEAEDIIDKQAYYMGAMDRIIANEKYSQPAEQQLLF